MNKKLVKIYGERNTGTNYLSRLIHLNLDVEELPGIAPKKIVQLQNRLPGREWVKDMYFDWSFASNLGWKHMKVKSPNFLEDTVATSKNVSFVTLTKNPYSWLLSLHKRPYHGDRNSPQEDFEAFLTNEYKPKGRDNVGNSKTNSTQLWNAKNASYIDLAKVFSGVTVRYEDLLDDPKQTLTKICQGWDVDWDESSFENYSDSTKDSHKDANFYRDYYLGEKWREKLSPQAVEIINSEVDAELMAHFGYERIESAMLA